jgi:hypothetical protein
VAKEYSWQQAFARQARSDFAVYSILDTLSHDKAVHKCHRLHYLQMACEKLTKAYLCSTGSRPEDLQHSHKYIAKNLTIIARQAFFESERKPSSARTALKHIKLLAREIELLAPSVDDNGRRPDNVEYPWIDQSGRLIVPAEFDFPTVDLLTATAGRTLLKLIERAINRLV